MFLPVEDFRLTELATRKHVQLSSERFLRRNSIAKRTSYIEQHNYLICYVPRATAFFCNVLCFKSVVIQAIWRNPSYFRFSTSALTEISDPILKQSQVCCVQEGHRKVQNTACSNNTIKSYRALSLADMDASRDTSPKRWLTTSYLHGVSSEKPSLHLVAVKAANLL
jgi:hypothetical protein